VDTARLRVLRTYPQVQTLLAALIANQELIPAGDHRVLQLDRLPGAMRKAVRRAQRSDRAWAAWHKGSDCFAITAELNEEGSRMHARPVLQVFLHDIQGRVIGSSLWLETRPDHWAPCES